MKRAVRTNDFRRSCAVAVFLLLLFTGGCGGRGPSGDEPLNGHVFLGRYQAHVSATDQQVEVKAIDPFMSPLRARMNNGSSIGRAGVIDMVNCGTGADWNPVTNILSVNFKMVNNSQSLPTSDPLYNKSFLTPIELRWTAQDPGIYDGTSPLTSASKSGLVTAVNTNLLGAGASGVACGNPGMRLAYDDVKSLDADGNLTVNTPDGFFDCLWPNQPFNDASSSAITPGWDISEALANPTPAPTTPYRLNPGQESDCTPFLQYTLSRQDDLYFTFDILGNVYDPANSPPAPGVNAVTSPTNLTTQTITGGPSACVVGNTVKISGALDPGTMQPAEITAPCTTGGNYSILIGLRTNTSNNLNITQQTPAPVYISGSTLASIVHDNVAPTVTGSSPVNGQQNVSNFTTVIVNFSEAMKASTFTNRATVFLDRAGTGSCSAQAINGTISISADGLQLVFDPSTNLTDGCPYRFQVYGSPQANTVKDLAGNALDATYDMTFYTATSTIDETPPAVLAFFPSDNSRDTSGNAFISVLFSEPMNTATFSATDCSTTGNVKNLALIDEDNQTSNGHVPFTLVVNGDGSRADLYPSGSLQANRTYSLIISACLKDLAGNILPRFGKVTNTAYTGTQSYHYYSIFKTTSGNDTTSPSIVWIMPPNGTTEIAPTILPDFYFSEPIDPNTVVDDNLFVTVAGNPAKIPIKLRQGITGQNVTFQPTTSLGLDTTYALSATMNVRDYSGNSLSSPQTSQLITTATPDTTPPAVLKITPDNGSTNNSRFSDVEIWFSEPVEPFSVNSSSVIFDSGGAALPAMLVLSNMDRKLTVTPGNYPLTTGTTYNLRINSPTSAAKLKDRAGNVMVAYTSTFQVIADSTRPTISAVWPANNTTAVPTTSLQVTFFSEEIDPGFIKFQDPASLETTTQARICRGCTATNACTTGGTTAYGFPFVFPNRKVIVTNAYDNLDEYTANTLFRVCWKSGGARDRSGNRLSANYVTSFTTGAGPDNTAPTISSTAPANGATAVSRNTAVTINFSKAIDPRTLNEDTILLHDSKGQDVAAELDFTTNLQTVTLTPVAPLLANELYVILVTTAVRDASGGNRLSAAGGIFSASFTTGP